MTAPTSIAKYYIGLMSGTSADGIDLSLVSFDDSQEPNKALPHIVSYYYQAYSAELAKQITQLYQPSHNEIDRAFSLDVALAHHFSNAIKCLLEQEQLTSNDIIAIGSHGQTIRHRPLSTYPFTLQIGCCQTLATLTGIRVIGQFRHKDIALGGQGAPLVPAFHDKIFREKSSDVFVVNIGGIANITYLPMLSANAHDKNKQISGFDTGPGNALMDDWFIKHHKNSGCHYDKNGLWASEGSVNTDLLKLLLADDYFVQLPPKSTGREVFNLDWLTLKLEAFTQTHTKLKPQCVQATLTMLSAISLCNEIKKLANSGLIYLCGGGIHNDTLVKYIDAQLNDDGNRASTHFNLLNTNAKNIDGDQLEAIAFAWLAFAYDNQVISNMPAVTGASKACTLGTCFTP